MGDYVIGFMLGGLCKIVVDEETKHPCKVSSIASQRFEDQNLFMGDLKLILNARWNPSVSGSVYI